MLRLAGISCAIVAATLSMACADEVRHLTFASPLVGIWALSEQACAAKDKSNLEIAESKYVDSGQTCAVNWIVETAGRPNPNYGVHAMCADPGRPDKRTAANLLIRPQSDDRIIVARTSGPEQTYRRCASK